MKRMRIAGIGLLVAAMLMLASCGQAQEAPEEDTVSEGVDTACTVSYSEKAAASDAIFLAEGDSIAVITPSALPSDERSMH